MPIAPVPSCSQAPLGQSCCCCKRCDMGGCDVRLSGCGCCFHTRCFPSGGPLHYCPVCNAPAGHVVLLPMAFAEIDQAQAQATSTKITDKRGRKRKNATIARLVSSDSKESSDLRTGRWTHEETAYCDQLIYYFEKGALPIPNGVKLHEFLAKMLKSKQSRLTKKMKNARLSTRQYARTVGYIDSLTEAKAFSVAETEFFASIRCNMERSEIRFHMQKEWRELFSNYCMKTGLSLDVNDWLQSVEELDRRVSQQKNATRLARRKEMMGSALRQDSMNSPRGVFIDPKRKDNMEHADMYSPPSAAVEPKNGNKPPPSKKRKFQPTTFIGRVVQYMQRHHVPFEHVDAWVPSFVSNPQAQASADSKCRLCFAGCGTTETQIPIDRSGPVPLTPEERYELISFGEYSQKFSFDVGSGLPGRVYVNDVSSWEQGIQNAPCGLFERKGGALQCGIQTVLGIPVPSPNVGRVVILFYSRHDRPKDQDLVNRMADELTKLLPAPRWKLVVDIGDESCLSRDTAARVLELESLISSQLPNLQSSPYRAFLPGFASLRLLFLKQGRSQIEEQLLEKVLGTFDKHKTTSGSVEEAVAMTARDFMAWSENTAPPPRPDQSSQQAVLNGLKPQTQTLSFNHGVQQEAAQPTSGTALAAHSETAGLSPSIQALIAQGGVSPSFGALPGTNESVPLNMTAAQLAAILSDPTSY